MISWHARIYCIYLNECPGYYYFCVWKDAASIRGWLIFTGAWLPFEVRVHTCYCPYMILVWRTWWSKASGWSVLLQKHCAQVPRLQDIVDSIFGRYLDCYPWAQERPRQACCVCVCVWRRMERSSALYCASNVLFSTAAIASRSHHVLALEAVAATPLTNNVLWMLHYVVFIWGRLLFCFAIYQVQASIRRRLLNGAQRLFR